MKTFGWVVGVFLACTGGEAVADPLTGRQAMRQLPKAQAGVTLASFPDRLTESDRAQLAAAGLEIDDVFTAIGASLSGFGAVAISPDEGMFVEWISGVSQHHSTQAARAAAIAYCNSKKRARSAECQVLVEVSPKGSDLEADLSLSEAAIAALRGPYRKLRRPKAMAISPSTGDFGFLQGAPEAALAACSAAENEATDCEVVIVN